MYYYTLHYDLYKLGHKFLVCFCMLLCLLNISRVMHESLRLALANSAQNGVLHFHIFMSTTKQENEATMLIQYSVGWKSELVSV